MPLVHNHDVISYDNHILDVTQTLVQLALENITCHCGTKWHDCILNSSKISIESCKKWGSFIKLLMPVSLVTNADSHYAGICKQMSNVLRVLKWYGSLTMVLFKSVGSKQILSFKLPDLSLPSTSTKLLIQGVASCTSLRTPTSNILLTSC